MIALVGLLLLTVAVLRPGFVDSDPTYASYWGRQLTRLESPTYVTSYSPTPHPLATFVAGLASLLGPDGGRIAMWLLTCVTFAGAMWLVFALTAELATPAAGVIAAMLAATNITMMSATTGSVVDVWVVALVLLATVLIVRKPRSGAPALLALAVAGLHRPEAWGLAAAYWLWLAPGEDWSGRVRLGIVAALAPLVWLVTDFAVTGNALFSIHDTRDAKLAEQVLFTGDPMQRGQEGLASIPTTLEILGRSMRDMLRLPGLLGGLAGLGLALVVARRRAALAAAPALLIILAFFGLAIAGLPQSDRFLLPAAAILAVFYGFAALGWLRHPRGRLRQVWTAGGCLLVLAAAASIPARIRGVDRVRFLADAVHAVDADLRDLLVDERLRARVRRCPVVFTQNHRPKPYVAYYLDRPMGEVIAAHSATIRDGAFVAAADQRATDRFVLAASGRLTKPAQPPPGFRPIARNRSWIVLVRGC